MKDILYSQGAVFGPERRRNEEVRISSEVHTPRCSLFPKPIILYLTRLGSAINPLIANFNPPSLKLSYPIRAITASQSNKPTAP